MTYKWDPRKQVWRRRGVGYVHGSHCVFRECKREPYPEVANNDEVQDKLWTETLKWLNIKEFGKEE